MEKDGFAACSMLTLGCVWRGGAALVGACTGGGTRGPCEGGWLASASSRLTESMRPRSDGADASGASRELRDAAAGSFCGGAGGAASGPVDAAEAPSGPSGSSTASSLVDWVPYWRRRGPRAAGERGAAAAVGVEAAFAAGETVASLVLWELSCAGVAAF